MQPREAVRHNWPEYGMEAAGLGLFMVSAACVTTALEYPNSPLHVLISDPTVRRVLIGLAMGFTAVAIIYSPWGKQSGAHLNPSVTLTFWRLGKIQPVDALCYMLAQFVGGALGLLLASLVIGMAIEHPAVNYVVTVPGTRGTAVALVAEVCISFGLMLIVLTVSNRPTLARWTGLCAGCLVAAYISIEAPLSGMSMNPARTLASALSARLFTDLWVYFLAPPLGMLLAAEVYRRGDRVRALACPKLHHENNRRCIFCGKPRAASPAARDPWSAVAIDKP